MDQPAMSILQRILQSKRIEVKERKARTPESALRGHRLYGEPRRPFVQALRSPGVDVIAELKKASPSRGVIREDFDVPLLAAAYQRGGASALSVLTDSPYFQGSLDYLSAARAAVSLPLLRKDFVVDRYQLHEARAFGADAVLLIAAALEPQALADLHAEALSLGLDVLVEVHSPEETARAVEAGAGCIGINNRDLRTFTVDLTLTEDLAGLIPAGTTIVSESGIRTPDDLRRLGRAGVHGVLIGEAFMREQDPGAALAALLRETAEDLS